MQFFSSLFIIAQIADWETSVLMEIRKPIVKNMP